MSAERLEAWHAHLLEAGRAPTTAHQYVMDVRKVFAWAAGRDEWRRLLLDPGPVPVPSGSPRTPPMALRWDQLDRGAEAAQEGPAWCYRLLLFLRYHPLRVAEAAHLRWEHVDLDAATLQIPPDHPGTKTRVGKRGRWQPLHPAWVAEAATWGVREGWLIDSEQLRTRGGGARAMVRRAWATANLPDTRQVTHAFRKTHTTMLLAAGHPEQFVRYLQGRSNGLTGDTYVDWMLMQEPLRLVVESIPAVGSFRVERFTKSG